MTGSATGCTNKLNVLTVANCFPKFTMKKRTTTPSRGTMNKHLLAGMAFGLAAQVLTFVQLQVNVKLGLMQRYPVAILLSAIPLTWMHIKAVEHMALAFGGQLWPGRLIGFGVGIVVFTIMGMALFGEGLTVKNAICLALAVLILAIQVLVD